MKIDVINTEFYRFATGVITWSEFLNEIEKAFKNSIIEEAKNVVNQTGGRNNETESNIGE